MAKKFHTYRRRGMSQRSERSTLDREHPLANGLVFAGLSPGSFTGSTLYPDSSLYGVGGTLTNMDASNWGFDATLDRWIVNFTGTDDYIARASGWPTITGNLTAAFWLKTASTSEDTILGFYSLSGGQYYGWGAGVNVGAAGKLTFWSCKSGSMPGWKAATSTGYNSGSWVHCAVSLSGTTVTLYKNGVADGTAETIDPGSYTDSKSIGADCNGGSNVNGGMGDVLIWNRALSAAEIYPLADPSNTLLSGLIVPPRRKWWPVVSAAPPAENYLLLHLCNKHGNKIGGGLGGKQCV